LMQLINRVTL